jgi:alkylhydroperoxidase family enzyme
MARGEIPLIPLADIPEAYVATAEMMNRLVGDAETIQVLAHSLPSTDFYFQDFYQQMFYNGREGLTVDVRWKQLLRLRISKRHGCALCNRSNEEEVQQYGFNLAQVDALFESDPARSLFSDAERSVIEFADQMVLDNQEGRLDAGLYARMRRHFSDEQIVEIAMVAAILVGAGKLTFVLNVVPREATCSIPARTLEAAE